MPPCEIALDGKLLKIPVVETTPLVDIFSLIDRALYKEKRRVAKASGPDGEELFNPAHAMRILKNFSKLAFESAPIPAKQRLAVVALNIACGKPLYQEMYEVSSPTFVDYAKRCGADYIVIDSQKILMSHLFYEKWQIFDMLFDYDRILYLDSDILVAPDCPNLFSFVQPDDVGAFVEDDFEERTALIFRTQLEHGCLNWFKGYVNAGMGVFSWLHRPLFKKGKSRDTSCLTEQNLLNFRIQLNQMPIHKLPKEFNRMDLAGEDKRLQSFLIHYAGRGHTGKAWTGDPVETLKTKIEIMRADRKWLEENRRA